MTPHHPLTQHDLPLSLFEKSEYRMNDNQDYLEIFSRESRDLVAEALYASLIAQSFDFRATAHALRQVALEQNKLLQCNVSAPNLKAT